MEFALFSLDGWLFILRWIHFLAGITWIGHLYYFNLTQSQVFTKADAPTKSAVVRFVVPEALWWFRWGAMFTIISGLLILMTRGHRDGMGIFATSWGVTILIGAVAGVIMWANVWFVIWPLQKIVMASAHQVAGGGQAIPEAAAAGVRAGCASRVNTLLSIPMLFFMGAASHLPIMVGPNANFLVLTIIVAVIYGAIEIWALTAKSQGWLTKRVAVIHYGLAIALVLYVAVELTLK